MTIKERKQRLIDQINRTEDEALLSRIEGLVEKGTSKFEEELVQLLDLSNQRTNLTPHSSAKNLIRK